MNRLADPERSDSRPKTEIAAKVTEHEPFPSPSLASQDSSYQRPWDSSTAAIF